jgi:hypothetical protein
MANAYWPFEFWSVSAAWPMATQNLVAVFVDQETHGAIKGDLDRYASSYAPERLPWVKFLIFPIDPAWFTAKDIQQILANLYYDGERDANSELVGLIVIGNVPFPRVEIDGKEFSSIFPYVNFVDPMFVYDPGRDIFAYNNKPQSQPQLFHSYLPNDLGTLKKFFAKLRIYNADPKEYAKPVLRHDDFIFMKQAFSSENLTEYIDTMVFAEDKAYRKYTKTFVDFLQGDNVKELVAMIDVAKDEIERLSLEPSPPWADEDPAMSAAQAGVSASSKLILNEFDTELIKANTKESGDMPIPTLPSEKTASTLFRTFDTMFGNKYLGELHRNTIAWWRYELIDIDTTMEKIQLRDNVSVTFLKDMNTLLEWMLDAQIIREKYALKYPLPVSYQKYTQSNPLFIQFSDKTCEYPLRKFENHYYGKNAEDIWEYDELTITRWTYLNFRNVLELAITPIDARNVEDASVFAYDTASVGMSLWLFAQQIHASRAFNLDVDFIGDEVELYQATDAFCPNDPREWARWYRGWWSPLYLDTELLMVDPSNFDFLKPSLYNYPEASNQPFWLNHEVKETQESQLQRVADQLVFLNQKMNWPNALGTTATKNAIQKRDTTTKLLAVENFDVEINETWWGWTSSTNPPSSSPPPSPHGPATAQMFNQMWNPSFDKRLWWPQYDIRWAIAVRQEYPFDILHVDAHHYFSKVIKTIESRLFGGSKVTMCEPKLLLNEIPNRDHFEEIEFFYVFEEVSEFLTDKDVDITVVPYRWNVDTVFSTWAKKITTRQHSITTDLVPSCPLANSLPNNQSCECMLIWNPINSSNPITQCVIRTVKDKCLAPKDYEYQIINTVVRHKWPTNEDETNNFSGDLAVMHALTMDRPVDDTRFVTFHGLWGDLVRLIYPNLFRVPVYKDGELLSEDEIKENIRTYLKDKIQTYNKQLEAQLNAAPSLYQQHKEWFDFLAQADPNASPNREYEMINTEMFEKVLGDDNLTRLASMLYYLNIWRQERPTWDTFEEFIEKARTTFDINRKIKYTMAQYVLKNDRERKQDPLLVPWYLTGVWGNGEHYAYEVWFINSDSFDTILPYALDLSSWSDPDFGEVSDEPAFTQVSQRWKNDAAKPTAVIKQDDAACGIASHKTVPLFQWPKALVCWYENLIKKPFDFKLRVRFDMPSTAVDDQITDWTNQWSNRWEQRWAMWQKKKWTMLENWLYIPSDDYIKPFRSSTVLAQWGMFWKTEKNEKTKLIIKPAKETPRMTPQSPKRLLTQANSFLQTGTWSLQNTWNNAGAQPLIPPSQMIEELLRVSFLDAQTLFFVSQDFNKKQLQALEWDEQWIQLHKHLLNNVVIRLSPWPLIDTIAQQEIELDIISLEDKGDVTITFAGTWSNCFSIAWRSTCGMSQDFSGNPARNRLSYRLIPQNKQAWTHLLLVTLCQWWVCAMKHEVIIVQPWAIDTFVVLAPTGIIPAWWIVPFRVIPTDENKNEIVFTNTPVEITVSAGQISYANAQVRKEKLTFSSIREASFFYYADDVKPWTEVFVFANQKPVASFIITDASMTVWYDNKKTLEAEFTLPKKEIWFTKPLWSLTQTTAPTVFPTNNTLQNKTSIGWWSSSLMISQSSSLLAATIYDGIAIETLPKITVNIEDKNWSPIATPYLLSPINNLVVPGYKEWDNFVPAYTFLSTWWKIDIYLLPLWRAWREEIIIQAPWVDDQLFILDILPSGVDVLDIRLLTNSIKPWDILTGTIELRDSWWNLFKGDTEVELSPEWAMMLNQNIVNVVGGIAMFTWMVWPQWWSCWASWRCNAKGGALPPPGQWETTSSTNNNDTNNDWNENNDGNNDNDEEDNDVDQEEDEKKEDEKKEDENKDNDEGSWANDDDLPAEDEFWKVGWGEYTLSSVTFDAEQLSRPAEWTDDQDLNIMYLNLFWNVWGNDKRIHDILRNSKTLAITTMFDGNIGNQWIPPQTVIGRDWSYLDPLMIIDSLRIEGDIAWIQLGNNGSIGRINLWRFPLPLFDKQETPASAQDMSSLRYQPLVNDATKEEKARGLVKIKWETVYNSRYWIFSSKVLIMPTWHAKNWKVMYENTHIGNLELDIKHIPPLFVELRDGKYWADDSDYSELGAVTIYYEPQDETATNTPFFKGIEESISPQANVWFRHKFMNITLFWQGQMVGHATKSYGNPLLLNIWDPFLERVKNSRRVEATNYDDGISQVMWTDNQKILKTSLIDFDSDGNKDMLIAYQDWSIRLLRNHWWTQPYKDNGTLMVFADGLKEVFIGDANGDGKEDIAVLTTADQLRVYTNKNGVFDVDGTLICLDVPRWEKNLSQVNRLYGWDMGNWWLAFVTFDALDDLRVHYWPAYLSTDPTKCDDQFRSRANNQLLKNFSLELWWAIKDTSLRHRPELIMPGGDEWDGDNLWVPSPAIPDITKMTKRQIKRFAKTAKEDITNEVRKSTDSDELLKLWPQETQLTLEIPRNLRHPNTHWIESYAGLRAEDDHPNPWFEVTKIYTNLNWSSLVRKGDMLKVEITITPLSSLWPASYWDSLDIPAIVYKDEQNKILWFDRWTLPWQVEVSWDVSPYQFRLDNVPLDQVHTFSYVVHFNSNGFLTFDVETLMNDFFKAPAAEWRLSSLFSKNVYAQWWTRRIRAIPADWCYKQYREFSPWENLVNIEAWYTEAKDEYIEFFDKQQKDIDKKSNEVEATTMKKLMRIPDTFIDINLVWQFKNARSELKNGWDLPEFNFGLDLMSNYLSQFVGEYGVLINKWLDRLASKINNIMPFNDFFIQYEKCMGIKFGKKSCGWLPMPFNISLLDPWTFNIFGCRLFKFDWLPLFAVPTSSIIPVWPPDPNMAWWVFGWTAWVSQFRLYVSPTLTMWLWFSLCFGPFGVWISLKSPIGDIAWNCLVITTMLGKTCTEPRKDPEEDQKETNYILEPNHMKLWSIPSCDVKVHNRSPFNAPSLGGKTSVPWYPSSIQSTLIWNNAQAWWLINDDAIGISSLLNSANKIVEITYLKWGTSIQLEVEKGDSKWLVSCILDKRQKKQKEYIANNLLNMNIFITLPRLEELVWNLDTLTFAGTMPQLKAAGWTHQYADNKIKNPWISKEYIDHSMVYKRLPLWRNILTPISDITTNPFRALADTFANFKLFTIETKEVTIQVPFIFSEDVMRYIVYLKERIERHIALLSELSDVEENREFRTSLEQAILTVNRNIQIIEEYQRFPTKLYELVSAYENFVSEIMHLVNSVVIQITSWMNINANRFSQFVDVIILLKWIIETRQVITDFSVNRQTRCAKCRQDDYDFYSCKLKLLCFDLPILPIPPFEFPDIYLDLSNLNLWLKVVLPEIRFIPKKIPLIPIPDFPVPRWLWASIRLPVIPMLPRPPILPEIPELKTDLQLTLPSLPPAPRIPNVIPSIKSVVKIADLVWTIFCIFKFWIGLVAEQGVKTRVEQMTQRTREIPFFDRIKKFLPDWPLLGFDIKVDTYVNLQVDVALVYELVEIMADRINEATSKAIYTVTDNIIEESQKLQEKIDNKYEWTGWGININIDLWHLSPTKNPILWDIIKERMAYNMYIGWSYEFAKKELLDGLAYIRSRDDLMVHHKDAAWVISALTRDNSIQINHEWLAAMKEEIKEYISPLQERYKKLANTILTDYDRFLRELPSDGAVLVHNKEATKDFGSTLFLTNNETIKELAQAPSLEESYLKMAKPMIDWYINAFKKETPESLWVTPLIFQQMNNDVVQIHNAISKIESKLLVQWWQQGWWQGWQIPTPGVPEDERGKLESMNTIEFADFIEWFFVPWSDGNFHNVIAWNEKWDERYKGNRYDVADLNGDWVLDFMFYTDTQVLMKYGNQNNRFKWPTQWWWDIFTIGPFSSMAWLIASVKKTHGRYQIGWTAFKIWDYALPLYDFTRQGQNFENMSVSRSTLKNADAYILKVSNYVWDLPSHWVDRRMVNWWNKPRYIVALPTTLAQTWLWLQIPYELPYALIDDHIKNNAVIGVRRYDPKTTRIDTLLNNMQRQRYYVEAAALRMWSRQSGFSIFNSAWSKKSSLYLTRSWPWSRQITIGSQYRWDDQPPVVSVKLIREITWDEVSAWTSLLWFVQTRYRMEATWTDAGEMIENRVNYKGDTIKFEAWDKMIIEGMDYVYPRSDQFVFYGKDQAGNIGQQTVTLEIGVPEIEIEKIEYEPLGATIFAQLSNEIDRGKVRFEVNRFGYRDHLRPNPFAVNPTDTQVEWWLYPFDTSVSFYSPNEQLPIQLDTDTWEIILWNQNQNNNNQNNNQNQGGWWSPAPSPIPAPAPSPIPAPAPGSVGTTTWTIIPWNGGVTQQWTWPTNTTTISDLGIHIDMTIWKPRIQIRDRLQWLTLYEITLVPQSLWITNPLEAWPWYKIIPINASEMWWFNGGYCIKERHTDAPCILYINENWGVFSPAPHTYNIVGRYTFNQDDKTVSYTFMTWSGRIIGTVRFIAQPLN